MTLGLTTATATSALNRETPIKETPETTGTHVEERLIRLWVRIGEILKRLRSTSAGPGKWWSEVGAGVEQGPTNMVAAGGNLQVAHGQPLLEYTL